MIPICATDLAALLYNTRHLTSVMASPVSRHDAYTTRGSRLFCFSHRSHDISTMSLISFPRFRRARDSTLITLLQYTPFLWRTWTHGLLYLDDDFPSRHFILGSFWQSEGALGSSRCLFFFSHFAVVGAFLQLDTFWFKRTLVVAGSIYNFQ